MSTVNGSTNWTRKLDERTEKVAVRESMFLTLAVCGPNATNEGGKDVSLLIATSGVILPLAEGIRLGSSLGPEAGR